MTKTLEQLRLERDEAYDNLLKIEAEFEEDDECNPDDAKYYINKAESEYLDACLAVEEEEERIRLERYADKDEKEIAKKLEDLSVAIDEARSDYEREKLLDQYDRLSEIYESK